MDDGATVNWRTPASVQLTESGHLVHWAVQQDAPVIVLVVDCCAGALQREPRSSKLSHAQALSTSSRSSLLALKKGIIFGGTSTRAPVFG